MSATYNWAYRPGVTNKYGFTIPTGADNVRPTGWCYVALFGNDSTGNGSRNYPYRTITKAFSTGSGINIVLGSGVYREASTYNNANNFSCILIGDGDATIDISYIGSLFLNNIANNFLYNIHVIGDGTSIFASTSAPSTQPTTCYDVFWDGACMSFDSYTGGNWTNCIVKNFSGRLGVQYQNGWVMKQCTFVNCNNIQTVNAYYFDSCIFYYCNISGTSLGATRYCLFFGCNFKINGSGLGGVLYPSIPTGYTHYSAIVTLQAAYTALYGGLNLTGCLISDPLFNNSTIGDYSLTFASPAKNLSYFGTYIGARSVAYQIKVSATENAGSFDFSTNVNLNIADDSITLVDPTQNAEIKTKLIINDGGRQISKFPIYGFNADRNGQYIDSITDLATVVKNASDTLTIPASYLVEVGAISYNSFIYQVGERLTTVSGQTTFTTSTGGVLREILEAPQRHTIMARFSDGSSEINSGDTLVLNYWYYVVYGNITYNTITYNAGQGFKAIDTGTFSGSGIVLLALSSEPFQHYEPGIQPTSNNIGDIRTGSIIRGNGDPAYVRGGYNVKEFPINAKFIQLYYTINVSNLRP